jgi:hypothetical protein
MDGIVRSGRLLLLIRRLEQHVSFGRNESVLAGLAVNYMVKYLLKGNRFTLLSLLSTFDEQ